MRDAAASRAHDPARDGPLGDERHHLDLETLASRLAAMPAPPQDRGTLDLVVSRRGERRRETPERVRLSAEEGVPGDAWKQRDGRPESQLAVMRSGVARLIANGQPLDLFGDNLLLDLDLSTQNLPAGSRLRVGSALLEVTPEPHNGCLKFRQRFGAGALRFTADERFRDQHLRGIYLRVVEDGEAGVGDPVEVVSRA